jgi:hypothetical protein
VATEGQGQVNGLKIHQKVWGPKMGHFKELEEKLNL